MVASDEGQSETAYINVQWLANAFSQDCLTCLTLLTESNRMKMLIRELGEKGLSVGLLNHRIEGVPESKLPLTSQLFGFCSDKNSVTHLCCVFVKKLIS